MNSGMTPDAVIPNCCLKLTACSTLAARRNPQALARRGLTMRYADGS